MSILLRIFGLNCNERMTLNILTFGIAREMAGNATMMADVPDNVSVSALKELIKERYPAMGSLSSFAIAVNGAYATADTTIHAADEVAIIPPVSGG